MAIRFHESDVRPMGRGAAGVKAISLQAGTTPSSRWTCCPETPEGRARAEKKAQVAEEIESDVDSIDVLELVEAPRPSTRTKQSRTKRRNRVAETIVDNDPYGQILTVTEKGFGKRTPIRAYRLTSRGAQGVSNIRITDKNGKVAGAAHVYAGDQLLLITEQGMMIRVACDGIRSHGPQHAGRARDQHRRRRHGRRAVKVVDREDDKEPLEANETGEEMDAGESSGEQ